MIFVAILDLPFKPKDPKSVKKVFESYNPLPLMYVHSLDSCPAYLWCAMTHQHMSHISIYSHTLISSSVFEVV